MCCTTKELTEFANPFKQSGICVGVDFKVWDNGERNTELNQAEFVEMDPLSGDLGSLQKLAVKIKNCPQFA